MTFNVACTRIPVKNRFKMAAGLPLVNAKNKNLL